MTYFRLLAHKIKGQVTITRNRLISGCGLWLGISYIWQREDSPNILIIGI
jgi:hypothetical protein